MLLCRESMALFPQVKGASAQPPQRSAAPHAADHALVQRLSVRQRKMKADGRGGLLERLAERRYEWREKRSLRRVGGPYGSHTSV